MAGATADNVVQLDRSRADVDTKTHPANVRDSAANRATSDDSDTEDDGDTDDDSGDSSSQESSEPVASGLSIAPDPVDDDSVGDLFASLREPKPEPKKAKTKVKAKKSSPAKEKKKVSSKKGANGSSTPPVSAGKSRTTRTSDVDSSELARRLKRVLADEQSRLMSTLKPMEDMPALDEILGGEADHRAKYWTVVEQNAPGPVANASEASDAIDSLIDTIRRRAGGAMNDANGDTGAAVVTLRSIYREIKTQQIGEIADTVCRAALAKA